MENDPLAKYRRRQEPVPGNQMPPSQPAYEAYKTSDRKDRLSIRRRGQLAYEVPYRYWLYLTHDEGQGTIINLVFGFMVVEIRGRNLQPVMNAIADGRCEFIRDFDPKAYPPPAPDQPIIESITITPQKKDC